MTVDLKGIIRDNKLDKRSIAKLLFPNLQHPVKGLQGVFQGRELNASQLLRLSLFLGVQVGDLYTEEGFTVKRVEGDVVLKNESYEAHYYLGENRLVLSREGKVEEFLVPDRLMTVPQLIKFVQFLLNI